MINDVFKDGTRFAFSNAPKSGQDFQTTVFQNAIVFAPDFKNPISTIPPAREVDDIKTFSAKSRKRLFEIFAKLDYKSYGVPVFVSATYHYDAPDTRLKIKTKIKHYFRTLKRILPKFHYITKLEYQKRGVPHFHFILLPLDKNVRFDNSEIMDRLKKHWLALKDCKCNHCKSYSVKTVAVKNYNHAVIYISKEIAKVTQNYQEHDLGRIWSTSRQLRIKKYYEFKANQTFYDKILSIAIRNVRPGTKSETYLKSLQSSQQPTTLFISLDDIQAEIDNYIDQIKSNLKIDLKRLILGQHRTAAAKEKKG
jgi:hypothetical protein